MLIIFSGDVADHGAGKSIGLYCGATYARSKYAYGGRGLISRASAKTHDNKNAPSGPTERGGGGAPLSPRHHSPRRKCPPRIFMNGVAP